MKRNLRYHMFRFALIAAVVALFAFGPWWLGLVIGVFLLLDALGLLFGVIYK